MRKGLNRKEKNESQRGPTWQENKTFFL